MDVDDGNDGSVSEWGGSSDDDGADSDCDGSGGDGDGGEEDEGAGYGDEVEGAGDGKLDIRTWFMLNSTTARNVKWRMKRRSRIAKQYETLWGERCNRLKLAVALEANSQAGGALEKAAAETRKKVTTTKK